MQLKKHYKKDEFGELELDDLGSPVFDYIEILRHSDKQNFSSKFIDEAIEHGFITISKNEFTLHAKNGDLTYKIIRKPGYYCCFDNTKHGSATDAEKYTKENYAGKKCQDANNPFGYRKDNFYHCEIKGVE